MAGAAQSRQALLLLAASALFSQLAPAASAPPRTAVCISGQGGPHLALHHHPLLCHHRPPPSDSCDSSPYPRERADVRERGGAPLPCSWWSSQRRCIYGESVRLCIKLRRTPLARFAPPLRTLVRPTLTTAAHPPPQTVPQPRRWGLVHRRLLRLGPLRQRASQRCRSLGSAGGAATRGVRQLHDGRVQRRVGAEARLLHGADGQEAAVRLELRQ